MVYIVDDDAAVRDSLDWLLGSAGIRCLCFENGQTFLDQVDPEQHGCVVLDVRLPGISGLDVHEQMLSRGIELPTIMITGHGDVSMAVQAMKAGVIDFLEKPFTDQTLLDRVRIALDRDLQSRQARELRRAVQSRADQLTSRERQVMEFVVAGKLNKQIATDLGLSHKTVEVHRARVMDKMQASSLAELVRMVMLLRGSDGR